MLFESLLYTLLYFVYVEHSIALNMNMEKLNFGYSFKNIPVPGKSNYLLQLVEKIELVVKRMRWKAHFYLDSLEKGEASQIEKDNDQEEYYGFKSRRYPKQIKELVEFEKDLFGLVNKIQFRTVRDTFQNKLKSDIDKINRSQNIFAFADKTCNIYEMPKEQYEKLLMSNITKTYKKAPESLERNINLEAQSITKKLKLDGRVEKMAQNPAYITLKDHKENFRTNPSCRLINPCKSELGKISKIILERANKDIVTKLKVNQWKNTKHVIEWFESIESKNECEFVQLDIKEFYPSISEETFNSALNFAKSFTTFSTDDLNLISHCRKSLLYKDKESWKKKTISNSFDVTMGSYDGAEVCELVGSFILSKLAQIIVKDYAGLYRDDGLLILKNINSRDTDVIRKKVVKCFKDLGFDIEITTKLKRVDFLDITLELDTGLYRPYKKPNDSLLYIHTGSNHPPNILKQLPSSICDRLSRNSANEMIFDANKGDYEEALKKCGHPEKLTYKKEENSNGRRNRRRNIIWFNPPFNKNVETNVAKQFLSLLDRHFPTTNRLHKIFNRNNCKVSYSCTQNLAQIIKAHNKKILTPSSATKNGCNCKKKDQCPLNGSCVNFDVIYKCQVTANNDKKFYIGATAGEWKKRYRNHVKSFNNPKYREETSLSIHNWKIKESLDQFPKLEWSIVKSCKPYSNISKRCSLCLNEKLMIISSINSPDILNKRSEATSKCLHEDKYLLKNFKDKD